MSILVDSKGRDMAPEPTVQELYKDEVRKVIGEQRGNKPGSFSMLDSFGEINTKINDKNFKSYKELNPHTYVEEHEVEENKKLIREHLGFEPPRAVGFNMCVKIYVRPEETRAIKGDDGVVRRIYLPDSARAHDKYRSCVALVCYQGNECYTNPLFQGIRWCNVGDWIIMPRNEGIQINYRDVPMQLIQDINMYAVVEDPSYVTRD